MRNRLNETLNQGAKKYRRRRRKKAEVEKVMTYTKRLVTTLTFLAAAWISWSYILATAALLMYGNVDPLSTVSEEVCRTVIATVLGYCVKSLFENISKYTIAVSQKDKSEEYEDSEYVECDYSNGAPEG